MSLPERGFLSVEEVAKWLGIGRTATFELVLAGIIPSHKYGRRRLIAPADLEAWYARALDQREIPTAPKRPRPEVLRLEARAAGARSRSRKDDEDHTPAAS